MTASKRKIKAEKLTDSSFAPFGSFMNFIDPECEKIGEKPIEFFPDMLQHFMPPDAMVSYSNVRCEKRELLIDELESHSKAGEALLPLDEDVLIQVAPATPKDVKFDLDKVKAFFVPKGTMVIFKPGTWHQAPYTLSDNAANVLVILPERTYANDGISVQLKKDEIIQIESL